MDAQELRNLQEAYMEVVANEAYKPFPKGKVDKKMASKAVRAAGHQFSSVWGDKNKSSENQEKANKLASQSSKMAQISTEKDKENASRIRKGKNKIEVERKRSSKRLDDIAKKQRAEYDTKRIKEEVDIYDIILSHLLDEGYAETPEAAEAIMVNMSEDWRESIVEEVLEEGKKEFPKTKVREKTAKHQGDYIKTRNRESMHRARKMNAIASTVEVGDDPRNTMHGQDLRKIR